MSLNLPNVGALIGFAAPGTPFKGTRLHALPDDFQSLLASTFVANPQSGAPLLAVRTTLQRGLTGALAPPGASPPKPSGAGPPANAKLTGIIQNAGQQNEIPGTILDADPAKEPSAPQKKPAQTEPLPDAAAAFARSLIAKATLTPPGPQAPSAAPAASNAAAPAEGSAQAPLSPTPAGIPQAPDVFPFAPSNVIAPAQQPASNPTGNDLLARMVSRAASAGAQHAAAPAPEAKSASSSATPVTAAFEKLASAIAASSGSQTQSQTDAQGDSSSQPHDTQQSTTAINGAQQPAMPSTASTGTISDPKPVAPYSTVDVNAVIEQVVKGIVINTTGSSSQIRLRLQPEHLGEVAVKLTVEGNSISANVVAQNAGVRDALLGAQPQLSRSLADAGLNLNAFSVNVSGGQAGSANDRQQARQPSSGFKIGGWNAGLSPDDDQPSSDSIFAPAPSGPRAMVINSLA